ncbi:MAG: hypothetical protein FJ031_02805 [Chloroflexi bacterium]|nr:hypothetical protein [Chloroflexota bacterium]
MEKLILLIGFLLLITVCQSTEPTPIPEANPTQTPLPTPIPDTPAPEISPTATVPPTPELPPYYFTDEFDTGSQYWEILQTGGATEPTFAYKNSTLRFDISSPDTWSIGVHNAHVYESVFVRARASASPTGSIGLICRYDEEAGWYEYNVSSDGTYNALYGQWLAPGVVKYVPLTSGPFTAVDLNYEIGLFCQDNYIFLYLNESLLRRLDVTNFGLAEGKIGIAASSLREAPITVLFEWVRVGIE